MPADRFYIATPFHQHQTLELIGPEFDHLCVMRPQEGDTIEIINGKNQLAIGTIQKIAKREATIEISKLHTDKPKKSTIILAQALPKMARLEYIIEKCTELQVSTFWLFPGMHSELDDISENKKKRLETLCIAAIKQCGRLDLPEIHFLPSLEKVDFSGDAFFGDTRVNAPSLASALQALSSEKAIICIGPEKGFHEKEIKFLESKKVKGVSLLDTTLRVETAAICAASITAHTFAFRK